MVPMVPMGFSPNGSFFNLSLSSGQGAVPSGWGCGWWVSGAIFAWSLLFAGFTGFTGLVRSALRKQQSPRPLKKSKFVH